MRGSVQQDSSFKSSTPHAIAVWGVRVFKGECVRVTVTQGGWEHEIPQSSQGWVYKASVHLWAQISLRGDNLW